MSTNAFACFSTSLLAAGAACVVVACGCGKGGVPTVATEMVEGVVTLDGAPVPKATVTFVPVQEDAGTSAVGMTNSEGKYALTAVGAGVGAKAGAGTLPGDYYVGVIRDESPRSAAGEADSLGEHAEEIVVTGEELDVTHVVPEKFNVPRKSGIKVTVKAGKNDIPIELKSN